MKRKLSPSKKKQTKLAKILNLPLNQKKRNPPRKRLIAKQVMCDVTEIKSLNKKRALLIFALLPLALLPFVAGAAITTVQATTQALEYTINLA